MSVRHHGFSRSSLYKVTSEQARRNLLIENLEDLSIEEVMEQFDVTREQITAVLDFVAKSLTTTAPASAPADAHPF